MVIVLFVLLFVEAEGERIGGFVVSVEGVDEVLAPDSVIFGVIVEATDAGDFVPGFLGDRVVDDDVAVFRPARFTVFLKLFEAFVVKLLFVPIILSATRYRLSSKQPISSVAETNMLPTGSSDTTHW